MSSSAFGQITRWVVLGERRSIVMWAVAVAAVSGFYAVFWGVFSDLDDLTALIESLPEAVVVALGYDQIATASGYLDSTVYSLLAPILLSVFAVVFAGRVLPGAEERGDLELEFAAPVSRTQILHERGLAVVLAVFAVSVAVWAVIFLVVVGIGMDVGLGYVAAATFGLFLYGLSIGMITVAVGATFGRRSLALGVGAGVAVIGFVLNAVAPLVDAAAWLTWMSPFAWYVGANALREGIDGLAYGGLAGLSAAVFFASGQRFIRRDLGV
ncbi:MAG: ABC transporter permease [Nitriliruptoraceae bacterium]